MAQLHPNFYRVLPSPLRGEGRRERSERGVRGKTPSNATVLSRRFQTLRLPLLILLLLTLCGCEKEVTRNDYFPLRDGNRWDYRLLDMPLLKRLEDGQAIETAPAGGKSTAAPDEEASPTPTLEAPAKTDEISQFRSPETKRPTKKDPALPDAGAKTDAKADPDIKPELTPRPGALQARRVTLELRDAVNALTYRAKYDSYEQVWSKKSAYVGFQSNRGRSYLLILPPHTGYRWVASAPSGEDIYYEIESAVADVTTPAGSFKGCAITRQESRDRKEIFRYWFAPDVGLVRRSKYFMNEEVFRQELVSYDVKPATPATRLAEEKEVQTAVAGKNHGNEFRNGTPSEREREKRNQRINAIEPIETDKTRDKVEKYADPK